MINVSRQNPAVCTPTHDCGGHPKGHVHGPNCGQAAVPHGDHCDDHGSIKLVDPKASNSTASIGESQVWGETHHDIPKQH